MPLRILTVCTANACRSPMAEAMLAQHCGAQGLDVIVRSAGTHGGIVETDPEAITAMREHGLDIAAHVPRPLSPALVREEGADLVLAMTRGHLREVATMGPRIFPHAFTVKEFVRRANALASAQPVQPAERADRHGRGIAALCRALGEGRTTAQLMGEDLADDIEDPYGLPLNEHRDTADELDALTSAIARTLAAWYEPGA